ncbi:MAG: hypothetical protein P1P84_23275 [Deferrisomatales bacterium]|nr:hypothetical protein [Deferrisomatales bacterium]
MLLGGACALLAIGLAWGETATAEPAAEAALTTWAPAEGEYRFGLMPFSSLRKRGEWCLGAARDLSLGAERGVWSYVGAGVSLERPSGGAADAATRGSLGGVELGAWVGGCLSCNLGGGASLDLEMRWAPASLSLGGDPLAGERRSGLRLRIPW